MKSIYWIEEVIIVHMDTALIPHITVTHAQKVKTDLKWKQRVITHWEDVHTGSQRICEVDGSIVVV